MTLDPERFLWRPGAKLISIPAGPIGEQWRKDLAFYEGDQWPAEVRANREADGRPVITFNRLPDIVDAICFGRRLRYGSPEWRAVVSDVVQKCSDEQKILNVYASSVAEARSLKFPPLSPFPFPVIAYQMRMLEEDMAAKAGTLCRRIQFIS